MSKKVSCRTVHPFPAPLGWEWHEVPKFVRRRTGQVVRAEDEGKPVFHFLVPRT